MEEKRNPTSSFKEGGENCWVNDSVPIQHPLWPVLDLKRCKYVHLKDQTIIFSASSFSTPSKTPCFEFSKHLFPCYHTAWRSYVRVIASCVRPVQWERVRLSIAKHKSAVAQHTGRAVPNGEVAQVSLYLELHFPEKVLQENLWNESWV